MGVESSAGPVRAAAVPCACLHMCCLRLCLQYRHSSSLGVAATVLWPRSCRGGGPAQSQSQRTRCSTAYSSGSVRRSTVWRSHSRGWTLGEAGRAMRSLSAPQVWFAGCTSCSSWRSQQLEAVERRLAQHVVYRLGNIMSSLAAAAGQETGIEAAILLQIMSGEAGGAGRPIQKPNRL